MTDAITVMGQQYVPADQLQDALDTCRDYRDENHRLLNLLKRVVEVFEMPTGDLEDAIADIVDDIKLCHPDWQG